MELVMSEVDATFKYTHSISLMNYVNDTPRNTDADGKQIHAKDSDEAKAIYVECTKRWDELYDFAHANFPRPESADVHYYDESFVLTDATKQDIQDVYELLRNHKQDEVLARLMSIAPGYRDVIFPVAIARYLLCYCDIPVYVAYSHTFTEFHHRYGYIVINAASR
jgi:transcriptional regulator of heat shock response